MIDDRHIFEQLNELSDDLEQFDEETLRALPVRFTWALAVNRVEKQPPEVIRDPERVWALFPPHFKSVFLASDAKEGLLTAKHAGLFLARLPLPILKQVVGPYAAVFAGQAVCDCYRVSPSNPEACKCYLHPIRDEVLAEFYPAFREVWCDIGPTSFIGQRIASWPPEILERTNLRLRNAAKAYVLKKTQETPRAQQR